MQTQTQKKRTSWYSKATAAGGDMFQMPNSDVNFFFSNVSVAVFYYTRANKVIWMYMQNVHAKY